MGAPPAPRTLLARVANPPQLAAAWSDVLASDLDDGVLGQGVARFAEDAELHLADIAAGLESGSYEPGRLTPVDLPRADGQTRVLHIPTVRDRIVERAILAVLTPMIDPWLGPFSFAYRPGLGVADAVQAVAQLRDEGLRWVARADFDDCFGSIPVSQRAADHRIADGRPGLALVDRGAARPSGSCTGQPCCGARTGAGLPARPWAALRIKRMPVLLDTP